MTTEKPKTTKRPVTTERPRVEIAHVSISMSGAQSAAGCEAVMALAKAAEANAKAIEALANAIKPAAMNNCTGINLSNI